MPRRQHVKRDGIAAMRHRTGFRTPAGAGLTAYGQRDTRQQDAASATIHAGASASSRQKCQLVLVQTIGIAPRRSNSGSMVVRHKLPARSPAAKPSQVLRRIAGARVLTKADASGCARIMPRRSSQRPVPPASVRQPQIQPVDARITRRPGRLERYMETAERTACHDGRRQPRVPSRSPSGAAEDYAQCTRTRRVHALRPRSHPVVPVTSQGCEARRPSLRTCLSTGQSAAS